MVGLSQSSGTFSDSEAQLRAVIQLTLLEALLTFVKVHEIIPIQVYVAQACNSEHGLSGAEGVTMSSMDVGTRSICSDANVDVDVDVDAIVGVDVGVDVIAKGCKFVHGRSGVADVTMSCIDVDFDIGID